MVAHQAAGMRLPAGVLARLSQGFDEVLAVHVVQKDIFAPIPSAHGVKNGPGKFNAQLAWHGLDIAFGLPHVQTRVDYAMG